MSASELKNALQGRSEVELTVTGRKTGNESTRPIWFVEDADQLLLLPVGGRTANWYRNIVQTPGIGLAADGADFEATAKPREDSGAVAEALEKFSAKYGADQVERFYPDQDAVVEVPLS